jgi:hypothetical protein
MNFAITSHKFTQDQMNRIDPRFFPFIDHWMVRELYKGQTVTIPSGSSTISIFNYFEVTDKPGEIENEKQLSLWCGWQGIDGNYDAEVMINLRIDGTDVNRTDRKGTVKAEIIKSGGAPMKVWFNGKLITDFTDKGWFSITPNGYQTVHDMSVYL